jgi:hypothetical protein
MFLLMTLMYTYLWLNAEVCALLGFYAALIGGLLLMFQDNFLVTKYQSLLCKTAEECRSHLNCGRA